MKNPKVSIVITTYGRAEYLKKLIESVRKTTPKGAYEIIIVSSDPPESVKVKWLKKQKDVNLIFADVRKKGQRRKQSLYHYTNLGIYETKYEWILVCNDDMEFDKNWYKNLKKIVNKKENKNVGHIIVASHIGAMYAGLRIAKIGRVKSKDRKWENLYLSDVSLIKKQVLKKTGYFDENMDWFGSGTDNSLAIYFKTNVKTVLAPEIKITHFIADEERVTNRGSAYRDFRYVRRKWDKWCRQNNCKYDCSLDAGKFNLVYELRLLFSQFINRSFK